MGEALCYLAFFILMVLQVAQPPFITPEILRELRPGQWLFALVGVLFHLRAIIEKLETVVNNLKSGAWRVSYDDPAWYDPRRVTGETHGNRTGRSD